MHLLQLPGDRFTESFTSMPGSMQNMSLVPYLTDIQWARVAPAERALLLAAQECDRFRVREVGRNDGPRVREYLRSAGITAPAPWCAAFVTWCLTQAGVAHDQMPKGPASACNWRAWADRRGVAHRDPTQAVRGDLFVWCNHPKSWTGHIGFVVRTRRILGLWVIDTIEGNTDGSGSRDGDGVYRRVRRLASNIWFIKADW
jgi:hypothetical protein